jgi:hypothetical protein
MPSTEVTLVLVLAFAALMGLLYRSWVQQGKREAAKEVADAQIKNAKVEEAVRDEVAHLDGDALSAAADEWVRPAKKPASGTNGNGQ